MGTLNSGYAGQHGDAAPLSMMPQQQQQPAPQVRICSHTRAMSHAKKHAATRQMHGMPDM